MVTGTLDRLFEVAARARGVLILPHNNPDPDAIASAVALQHLLAQNLDIESHVGYWGVIGRAENRALVRYLGRPLQCLRRSDLRRSASVALVDTQAGAGNVTIPAGSTVVIAIDHHTQRPETAAAAFADIRPELGATSTILTQYLQATGIKPIPTLATALFYGINTNTMGLGRDANPADAAAYRYLQPLVDVQALARIEQYQVPAQYFKSFNNTLHTARIYGNVVIAYVGPMKYPDLASQMADLLLRLERSQWVITMGTYERAMVISARTHRRHGGAEQLVQSLVGKDGPAGGHKTMAGGQIPLRGRDPDHLAQQIGRRALDYFGTPPDTTGEPII